VKKLLITLAAATLLASPAFASEHGHQASVIMGMMHTQPLLIK